MLCGTSTLALGAQLFGAQLLGAQPGAERLGAQPDAQLVALFAGLELLSVALLAWRGTASPRGPLVLQGAALAGLVLLIGLAERHPLTIAVAGLVLVLKAGVLPRLVARHDIGGTAASGRAADPTRQLLTMAALVVVAYLVSRPLTAIVPGPTGRALPVGLSLVLVGFVLLVTGERSRAQLVGFLVLDNGIATTAFLATGGVPVLVELGVSLDVLLVVLVLQVLGGRMVTAFGGTDLDQLTELRD
jgi:hydrogenase-4 component E